mgnify:CR=1 FL=1
MAIRIYKKTSAGRRNASVNLNTEVTKKKPEKSLLAPKIRSSGRNNSGKITVQCRKIDFKRTKNDVTAKVVGIEYDPNRTCHIALLEYADGEKRYILAPVGLTDGHTVESSTSQVEPKVGNSMPLAHIPAGLEVHCVGLVPGEGGLCPPDQQGSRLGDARVPVRRNPPGRPRVPRDDRPGRQH